MNLDFEEVMSLLEQGTTSDQAIAIEDACRSDDDDALGKALVAVIREGWAIQEEEKDAELNDPRYDSQQQLYQDWIKTRR